MQCYERSFNCDKINEVVVKYEILLDFIYDKNQVNQRSFGLHHNKNIESLFDFIDSPSDNTESITQFRRNYRRRLGQKKDKPIQLFCAFRRVERSFPRSLQSFYSAFSKAPNELTGEYKKMMHKKDKQFFLTKNSKGMKENKKKTEMNFKERKKATFT